MQKLSDFLESYLRRGSIFKNKKALQSNYTPKNVPYRSDQINQLGSILAPCLRTEKPSNVFIYGKTGCGKTLVARHVCGTLQEIAEKNKINLKFIYLNCKLKRIADTEYRLIAEIARSYGIEVPATGLPTDQVYKLFVTELEQKGSILVIILDEVDQLVKKTGDGVLYNLTRLNGELHHGSIVLIGISNDLMFIDHIDARVKSSLSEEEILFPPYDAVQLQKILLQRAKIAFHDSAVAEGVIEKCAAYAAREHGDARRALELLRVAGELAERKGERVINVEYIDGAEEKIERDRVFDMVSSQPIQFKATLYSILQVCHQHGNGSALPETEDRQPNGRKRKGIARIYTGDVYDHYGGLCKSCNLKPLTQRRVGDIIAELDMLGIINAKVISKGRYGRTREITVELSHHMVESIETMICEGLGLRGAA